MNCNKCGTPIIPGENTCRFCGSYNDFSKREKAPEIIGFDDIDYISTKKTLETEIIDFMMGEDEVTINEEEDKPIIIDDLIEKEENKEVEKEEQVIDNNTDLEGIVNSIIDEPPTAKIPVEEVNKTIEDEEEVVLEPSVNLDATVSMEKIEEPKKETTTEVVEETAKPKKKNVISTILLVIVTVLLIASLIINYFLFTGKDNNSSILGSKQENKLSNISYIYKNYNMLLPNSWLLNDSNDNYLLLSDNTESWKASLSFVNGLDYSLVKDKTQAITDLLGNDNYLFTSDYNKTVNNKEFYIFKGKYYEYAVYVIVTEIDNDIMAIIDLKFIGEVEEDVLNSILETLSSSTKKEENIIKENFEFKDISNSFRNTIAKVEKKESK